MFKTDGKNIIFYKGFIIFKQESIVFLLFIISLNLNKVFLISS